MTRLDALRALLAKVEAGETDPLFIDWADALGFEVYDYGRKAYAGSLDAAKSLHDAVLPGWIARHTWGGSSAPYTHVFRLRLSEEDWPFGANSAGYNGTVPAVAWEIAILRASIYLEEAKG